MGRLIGLIYFYLVSLVGLVLLLVGLYAAFTYFVNTTQYDEYPLLYPPESCDTVSYPAVPVPVDESLSVAPSPDIQYMEEQKVQCEERLEAKRKDQRLGDVKNAIFFTAAGILLLGFHLPFGVKKSRDKK